VPWAGSLARGTSSLGLGITVRPSHGRHPSMVARDVTTIDLLTDGRAVVALVEDGERTLDVDRLVEAASVLRRLLTEEQVTVSRDPTTRWPSSPPDPARCAPEGRRSSPESWGRPTMVVVSSSRRWSGDRPTGMSPAAPRMTWRRDGWSWTPSAKDGAGPMLLWRGSLGPDHATAAGLAESVLGAGADGLIAVLGPDSAVEGGLDASAVGRVLEVIGPLAGRFRIVTPRGR
jgi:hypothetical protein